MPKLRVFHTPRALPGVILTRPFRATFYFNMTMPYLTTRQTGGILIRPFRATFYFNMTMPCLMTRQTVFILLRPFRATLFINPNQIGLCPILKSYAPTGAAFVKLLCLLPFNSILKGRCPILESYAPAGATKVTIFVCTRQMQTFYSEMIGVIIISLYNTFPWSP